jgi:hypothetical protein
MYQLFLGYRIDVEKGGGGIREELVKIRFNQQSCFLKYLRDYIRRA